MAEDGRSRLIRPPHICVSEATQMLTVKCVCVCVCVFTLLQNGKRKRDPVGVLLDELNIIKLKA